MGREQKLEAAQVTKHQGTAPRDIAVLRAWEISKLPHAVNYAVVGILQKNFLGKSKPSGQDWKTVWAVGWLGH